METMTERHIISRLRAGECFAAEIDTGSFQIVVRSYSPVVATAIHDGHRVVDDFAAKMAVSEAQRKFEEDPHTGALGETLDISITVRDSRYCGDLNRTEERCIYDEAWGLKVWREPLDDASRLRLLENHRTYYRVLDALLSELCSRYGTALLFDLHSYNYERLDGSPPLFNIGTHYIDMDRFGGEIDHLLDGLGAIELPDCENRAVLDEVFVGRGYQAEFVHQNYPDVLCVPLELKKVFMDARGFAIKKDIYEPLFAGTEKALAASAAFFVARGGADARAAGGHDARN